MDNSKVISTSTPEPMRGGKSGGDKSGPTGSARTYPKGKTADMDTARFNPMNSCASTYGLEGA